MYLLTNDYDIPFNNFNYNNKNFEATNDSFESIERLTFLKFREYADLSIEKILKFAKITKTLRYQMLHTSIHVLHVYTYTSKFKKLKLSEADRSTKIVKKNSLQFLDSRRVFILLHVFLFSPLIFEEKNPDGY